MPNFRDVVDFFLKPYATLDRQRLGLNAFFNLPIFQKDNIQQQAIDIHKNLGIKTVRILFHWETKGEKDPIYFDFVDTILSNLPDGLSALVILGGAPNWLNTKPLSKRRELYVEFGKAAISRYRNHPRVIGFQVYNEPNTTMFPENLVLDLVNDPQGYVSLLKELNKHAKEVAPSKLIVSAAPTSLLQNFPNTLNFFKKTIAAGLQDHCDRVGVHHYGTSPVSMLMPGGVLDTLRNLQKPVWITETGSTKIQNHTNYLLKYAGFILEKVPNVELVFWYHYDGNDNFGIRTQNTIQSPLYSFLSTR